MTGPLRSCEGGGNTLKNTTSISYIALDKIDLTPNSINKETRIGKKGRFKLFWVTSSEVEKFRGKNKRREPFIQAREGTLVPQSVVTLIASRVLRQNNIRQISRPPRHPGEILFF